MKGKAEIREFVLSLLTRIGDDGPLADNDSLLLSGRLQSVDGVEIILFLEEHFGMDFAQIGFDRDQIDSIEAIHTLIQAASSRNQ
jgi:acyl carrier protein